MESLTIILIIIVLALAGAVWVYYKKSKENEKEILAVEKERDEYENLGKGLAEYNQKLQERKNQAKDKILGMLGAKAKISNRDVVGVLNISDASAVRYLDELEKERKIKQVGKTGKKVFYTL